MTLKNLPYSIAHPPMAAIGMSSTKKIRMQHRELLLFSGAHGKTVPIESVEQPLQLKTAQDFASNLSVHVNHLNSSVKNITGKSQLPLSRIE
jgi:hypothetical protein